MNNVNLRKSLVAAAVLLFGLKCLAQMPGSGGGFNTAMMRLFGDTSAFTTKADVQVLLDKTQKEWVRMPMNFAVLDGKIRVDIDMAHIKSQEIGAAEIASFKQLGMDRVTSITRPDKKALYIIYPGAKSYVNMNLPAEETELKGKKLTVQKTALGQETVDGHPCVKNQVAVKDDKGRVLLEAKTWNATDLKEFPVRIETKENDKTTILHLRQVSFARPDPKQFEAPAGLTRYSDPQALAIGVSSKFMKSEGANPGTPAK